MPVTNNDILKISIDKDAKDEILDMIVDNKIKETDDFVYAVNLRTPLPRSQYRIFTATKALANKVYNTLKTKYKKRLQIKKYDVQYICKEYLKED